MIHAHVAEGPWGDHLKVYILDKSDGQNRRLLQHGERDSWHWVDLAEEGAAVSEAPDATCVLPYDSGRALLDALTRHYQGAEDTRQLRRDYDAERKRVDSLTTVLADIARASLNS